MLIQNLPVSLNPIIYCCNLPSLVNEMYVAEVFVIYFYDHDFYVEEKSVFVN